MTTLYVAMESGVLVARREARGWTVEQVLEERNPQCLAVDPRAPDRVYVGTAGDGVWASRDGGRTWTPPGAGLEEGDVTAVAVGLDGDAPGPVYAGTEPSAVFRSTDGGGRWTELRGLNDLPSAPTWTFPPRPETHHVRWVGVDSTRPGRLYVAVEAGALVRSLDGGETWLDRVPTGPYDTHTLAVGATGRLHSAAGDGYYESGDGGDTWEEREEGLRHGYLYGVAVLPADPDLVLVSAASGPYQAYSARSATTYLYRKRGSGRWERVSRGLPEARGTTIATFATHAPEPDAVYAASNRGVFKTTDGGESWEPVPLPWPEPFLAGGVEGFAVAEL